MRDSADRNWSEHEVKRFLDQLAAGGHDFQRLVEQLPVIVYTAELGERGRWRYVSPQVEEILGYKPEEFVRDPGLWADPPKPVKGEAHDRPAVCHRLQRGEAEGLIA